MAIITEIFSHLMLQSFRQLVLISCLVEQSHARLIISFTSSPLAVNIRYLHPVHLFIPQFYIHAYIFLYIRAHEPMARVPKMTLGKISLSRGIHCCPNNFFRLFCPTSFCSAEYVYIHISDCVEILYGLPLLPNNNASEIFLHKLGAVRRVHRTLSFGCRPGVDCANA
jgi:hypothetical protein